MCVIDSKEHRACHREDVNCAPLSEVMYAGTPNLWIQPVNNAVAQSAAEIPEIGMASGHLVVLSTTVKR